MQTYEPTSDIDAQAANLVIGTTFAIYPNVPNTYGVQKDFVAILLVCTIFLPPFRDLNLMGIQGFLPPLMSVTFVRVVSFSTYQNAKYKISDEWERATGISPLVSYNEKGSVPSLATVTTFTIAGMCAGLAASPFACELPFSSM